MDSREKTITFDLGKVDFKWVDETNKVKELKRAYAALKEDGGHYKELEEHLKQKILSLDPKFERHMGENNISTEERANLTKELLQWEDQVTQQDHELKGTSGSNGDIFENQGESSKLTPLQQKKEAEAEKQKGNDFMRSSDFLEALSCYNRSVGLNPEDPATYSNRALAQIKLKDFAKAKQDADKALTLKPDYIKAFHRLAKAYEGLGDLKKAVKSFKEVLKLEPQNKDAPIEIKRLEEKMNKEKEKKEEKEKKVEKKSEEKKPEENFKRVQIEEDSDDESEADEEGEPEQEQKVDAKENPVENQNQEDKEFTRPHLMKRSSSFWEEADTPQQDEDEKKLRAQIKEITEKVDALKEEAKNFHQKGNYDQALSKYERALGELEVMGSGMTKVRLIAQIHNNMAACYKQNKDNRNVKKYATLVIESGTDETNLIGKALWRRGLSEYEEEKFKKALEDLEKARSYGITQNIGMIIKNIRDHLEEHHEEEEAKEMRSNQALGSKRAEEPKSRQEGPVQRPESLEEQVKKLKESGNAQFKAQDYSSAIRSYTEAFELYNGQKASASEQTKTMVKQCLGNRSLVYYKQEEWQKAIDDCTIILNEFDPQFKKALLRRGTCYNQMKVYDKAARDLQNFKNLEPQNEDARKELGKALAGFQEQIKKQKEEQKQKERYDKLKEYEARLEAQEAQKEKKEEERKREEQRIKEKEEQKRRDDEKKAKESQKKEAKKNDEKETPQAQKETTAKSTEPETQDKEEEKKQSPLRGRKTKFNQELVKQANEKAKEKIGQKKPLPINMFEFNNYWGNLRTEAKEVRLQYLKSIPLPELRKIFKASQINQAHFTEIIDLLLEFPSEIKFTITFIAAISKFESFETLVDIQLSPPTKKKLAELVSRGLEEEVLKKKTASILKKL